MKNPFFCFNFILRGKGWSVIIPHMTKDAGGKDRYETQSQIAASLADVSVCAVERAHSHSGRQFPFGRQLLPHLQLS